MPVPRSRAVDSVEEEDNGFKTVDDGEGESSDRVVISIPVKKMAKPEVPVWLGKP